jgi:hypothetical protein
MLSEIAFWARIDRSGGPDACWPWTWTRHNQGYGVVCWRAVRSVTAHHIAYELAARKSIPDGWLVFHKCGTPECCNPRHLLMGPDRATGRGIPKRERRYYVATPTVA